MPNGRDTSSQTPRPRDQAAIRQLRLDSARGRRRIVTPPPADAPRIELAPPPSPPPEPLVVEEVVEEVVVVEPVIAVPAPAEFEGFVTAQSFRANLSVIGSATFNLSTATTAEEFNRQADKARRAMIDLGAILAEVPPEELTPAFRQQLTEALESLRRQLTTAFGRTFNQLTTIERRQLDAISAIIDRRLRDIELPTRPTKSPEELFTDALAFNVAEFGRNQINEDVSEEEAGRVLFVRTTGALRDFLDRTGFDTTQFSLGVVEISEGFRVVPTEIRSADPFANAQNAAEAFETYGFSGGFIDSQGASRGRTIQANPPVRVPVPYVRYPNLRLQATVGGLANTEVGAGAPVFSTFIQTALRDFSRGLITSIELRDRFLDALGLESVLKRGEVAISPEEGIVELRRRRRADLGLGFRPLARNEFEARLISQFILFGLPLVLPESPPRNALEAAAILNQVKQLRVPLSQVAPSSLITPTEDFIGPGVAFVQPVVKLGALSTAEIARLNAAANELKDDLDEAAIVFFEYSSGLSGFATGQAFRYVEQDALTVETIEKLSAISGNPDSIPNRQLRNLGIILDAIIRSSDQASIPALSLFQQYATLLTLYISTSSGLQQLISILEETDDPQEREDLTAAIAIQEELLFGRIDPATGDRLPSEFERQAEETLTALTLVISLTNYQRVGVSFEEQAIVTEGSPGFRVPLAKISFTIDPNDLDPLTLHLLLPEEFPTVADAQEFSLAANMNKELTVSSIEEKFFGFLITAGADQPGGKAPARGGGSWRGSRQNRARVASVNQWVKNIEKRLVGDQTRARLQKLFPETEQATVTRLNEQIELIITVEPAQAGRQAVNAYLEIATASAAGKITPQQRYNLLATLMEVTDGLQFRVSDGQLRPFIAEIFGVGVGELPEFRPPRIKSQALSNMRLARIQRPDLIEEFTELTPSRVREFNEETLEVLLNAKASFRAQILQLKRGTVKNQGTAQQRSVGMTFDAIVEDMWKDPITREAIIQFFRITEAPAATQSKDVTERLVRKVGTDVVKSTGMILLWEEIFESQRQKIPRDRIAEADRETFGSAEALFTLGQEYLVDTTLKTQQKDGGFGNLLSLRIALRQATISYSNKVQRGIVVGAPAITKLNDGTEVVEGIPQSEGQKIAREVFDNFQINPTDPVRSRNAPFEGDVRTVPEASQSTRLSLASLWIKDAKNGELGLEEISGGFDAILTQGRVENRVLRGQLENLILAEVLLSKPENVRDQIPRNIRAFPEMLEGAERRVEDPSAEVNVIVKEEVRPEFDDLVGRAGTLRPGESRRAAEILADLWDLRVRDGINNGATVTVMETIIRSRAVSTQDVAIEFVSIFLRNPVPNVEQQVATDAQLVANRVELFEPLRNAKVDVLPGASEAEVAAQRARTEALDAELAIIEGQLAPLAESLRRQVKMKGLDVAERQGLDQARKDVVLALDRTRSARTLLRERGLNAILKVRDLDAEIFELRRTTEGILDVASMARINSSVRSVFRIRPILQNMTRPITEFIIQPIFGRFFPGMMTRLRSVLPVFQVVEFAFWTVFIFLGLDRFQIINVLGTGAADTLENSVRDLAFSSGRIEKLITIIDTPEDPNVQRAQEAIEVYERKVNEAEANLEANREKLAFSESFVGFVEGLIRDAREVQLPTLKRKLDRKLRRFEEARTKLEIRRLESDIRNFQQSDPGEAQRLRVIRDEARERLRVLESPELEVQPQAVPQEDR